ncbi:hypothetical protein DPMN_074465 [Dreissena polymorpha]|uniref:Uncharacterized protein n=1 Tax=Dreissena polymorpha TaxID=45954 RepID=A0A9D3YFB0_DREPO|nr:hypothetical protein DPMN_074465 [Dreissena polymorpha]
MYYSTCKEITSILMSSGPTERKDIRTLDTNERIMKSIRIDDCGTGNGTSTADKYQ